MEMKSFLGDDFLLNSRTAVRLYHEVAALQPIIDYHNHLPPREITQNRRFTNLSEAWLEGDHYKWRAMRTAAVPERLCTGSASPREKFSAWAAVVPQTLGNPLYHWTHLELRRYFGIGDLLSPTTAEAIWERANAVLAETSHGARGLLAMMNVQTLCTTDDPADNLAHHIAHQKAGSPQVDMRPAFRPDKTHDFRSLDAWNAYIERLGDSAGAGAGLRGWEDLLEVLMQRHAFFHQTGCRLSDHGVEFVPGLPWTPEAADAVMKKALSGIAPAPAEILLFRSAVMESCARMDAAAGWTMQIHMGALRNVNPRRLADLGPDTGFDVIGDFPQAAGLVRHLGALAEDEALPRTILYNLNPADNEVIASIIGAFAGRNPRKSPVRLRLVVQRPERRHDPPNNSPGQPRPALPIRRHAHRQPQLPLIPPSRILPPHPLQYPGHLGRSRRNPQPPRTPQPPSRKHLLPKRPGLLRLQRPGHPLTTLDAPTPAPQSRRPLQWCPRQSHSSVADEFFKIILTHNYRKPSAPLPYAFENTLRNI